MSFSPSLFLFLSPLSPWNVNIEAIDLVWRDQADTLNTKVLIFQCYCWFVTSTASSICAWPIFEYNEIARIHSFHETDLMCQCDAIRNKCRLHPVYWTTYRNVRFYPTMHASSTCADHHLVYSVVTRTDLFWWHGKLHKFVTVHVHGPKWSLIKWRWRSLKRANFNCK